MEKEIELSVLLPSYNYPEGIERVLSSLLAGGGDKSVEIIISDNSRDCSLQNVVKKFTKSKTKIYYTHNNPATDPAENWNSLIKKAKGSYYVLIHHDEFLGSDDFFPQILKYIKEEPDMDFFMLDCILMNFKKSFFRRHVPNSIRSFVVDKYPGYLFKRNVVGPTASLVIKNNNVELFDGNIFWLLDVDMYYRLITNSKKWKLINNIKIVSYIDRGNSLTSSLGNNIPRVRKDELFIIGNKYKNECLVNFFESKKFKIIENILWCIMRFSTFTLNHIKNSCGFYILPEKKIREFLDDNK